jgi:hypothetical protein
MWRRHNWVTFHGTRKQADSKLTELLGDAEKGQFVELWKMTLIKWLPSSRHFKLDRRPSGLYPWICRRGNARFAERSTNLVMQPIARTRLRWCGRGDSLLTGFSDQAEI